MWTAGLFATCLPTGRKGLKLGTGRFVQKYIAVRSNGKLCRKELSTFQKLQIKNQPASASGFRIIYYCRQIYESRSLQNYTSALYGNLNTN